MRRRLGNFGSGIIGSLFTPTTRKLCHSGATAWAAENPNDGIFAGEEDMTSALLIEDAKRRDAARHEHDGGGKDIIQHLEFLSEQPGGLSAYAEKMDKFGGQGYRAAIEAAREEAKKNTTTKGI